MPDPPQRVPHGAAGEVSDDQMRRRFNDRDRRLTQLAAEVEPAPLAELVSDVPVDVPLQEVEV